MRDMGDFGFAQKALVVLRFDQGFLDALVPVYLRVEIEFSLAAIVRSEMRASLGLTFGDQDGRSLVRFVDPDHVRLSVSLRFEACGGATNHVHRFHVFRRLARRQRTDLRFDLFQPRPVLLRQSAFGEQLRALREQRV